MIRKLSVLSIITSLLLFASCGSTQMASDVTHYTIEKTESEPDVIVEKDDRTDITIENQQLQTDITVNPENQTDLTITESENESVSNEEASPLENNENTEEVSLEVVKEEEPVETETFEFTKIDDEDVIPSELPQDQLYISPEKEEIIQEEILQVEPVQKENNEKETDSEQTKTEAAQTDIPATASSTVTAKSSETKASAPTTPAPVKKETSESDHKKNSEPIAKSETDEKTPEVIKEDEEQPVSVPQPGESDVFNSPVVIRPSRSVTVKNNQYLDVVYPGSGWVYIGETQKTPLFTYFGRKIAKGNTTFTLRSKISGQTVLHFYKNDPLTGEYIDDYLDVTVENTSAKPNTRTQAPSYAEVVPPKPEKRGVTEIGPDSTHAEEIIQNESSKHAAKQDSYKPEVSVQTPKASDITPAEDTGIKTIIQNTAPSSEKDSERPAAKVQTNIIPADEPVEKKITIPSGNLLEEAKKAYNDKQYENALTYIQLYLDSANSKIDEALFVQGQILEAESSVKNIRSAIDSYSAVVNKYPSSKFWKKSNERIIYLKRFYIDIR